MRGVYKACFVLPVGAEKVLGEDGWDFESSARLPKEIKASLIESLGLEYSESYLGIDVYINENIQMSVTSDDSNLIESISFQVYDEDIGQFKSKLEAKPWHEKVEIFVPSERSVS